MGWGSSTRRGWWPKTSCPPSKVCLPWVSKKGIWDVPRILPGCPGPLGVFEKLVQKNFVPIFRSLRTGVWKCHALGAFLQTPAPVLDKNSGPMGAQFLSSTGLGFVNLIERAQLFPAPALDKNQSPSFARKKSNIVSGVK